MAPFKFGNQKGLYRLKKGWSCQCHAMDKSVKVPAKYCLKMGHLWNEYVKLERWSWNLEWSYLRLGQVSRMEGRRWYESKEQESKLSSWRCGLRNKGTEESSRRRQFMVRLLRRPPPLVMVLPRMWATVWAFGENVCQTNNAVIRNLGKERERESSAYTYWEIERSE